MKRLLLLSFILLAFAACQKAEKAAHPLRLPNKDSAVGTKKDTVPAIKYDTIPDHATLNIRLVMDSTYYDDIQFGFNHTNHLNAVDGGDAGDDYLPLPGQPGPNLGLSAISSDGKYLAINAIPYTHGMTLNLYVTATASGNYFLGAWRLYTIPSDIHIWCKDTHLKDSLDLRTGNYHFNIDKTDTSTFGANRFKIVLR